MESRFTMTWNADELAHALKVTVQDVKEYFTDGRRVSFVIDAASCGSIQAGHSRVPRVLVMTSVILRVVCGRCGR